MTDLGVITLMALMALFIAIAVTYRDKVIGIVLAILLILSVMLSYATMGIGTYKSSLETLLDSDSTYDVVYYEFPSRGPVIFLLKAEGEQYPKYYLIDMSDAEKSDVKKKLDKLAKQKIKLGHGTIQMKNNGTEDDDYGIVLDTNEHRPELQEKPE